MLPDHELKKGPDLHLSFWKKVKVNYQDWINVNILIQIKKTDAFVKHTHYVYNLFILFDDFW